MIIFEQVSKFRLTDIRFCVPKGESVGVIGVSGAGKTTLLKLACGLLKPQAGNVYTKRRDPVRARKFLGTKLAAAFESVPIFQEHESIRQSLENIRDIYGMKEEEFARRYARLQEMLEFAPYEEEPVKNLSLGQKRRGELATVFLRDADLIVLDEPEIGLDQHAKEVLRMLLKEQKEKGATLLISSHDMDEISDVCDRILLLDRGQIAFYGRREMLLKKYAPMDVCELDFAKSQSGGSFPSFADLPIEHYELHNSHLVISFNSNHISSAEILSHIMSQVTVLAVTVRKGDLLDSVKKIAGERSTGFKY